VFELIKPTCLDIKDAACIQVVHLLQHPISRPTTRATQDTMVNAPKKNILPLLAGRCGKSKKHSTRRHDHANPGKSGLKAEMFRAFGALHSL
jgi:hypothetical protein